MAIDPKIIREHYAGLNDDALLRVDRGGLTTAAQGIFDTEVRRRGLDREALNEEMSDELEAPGPLLATRSTETRTIPASWTIRFL